MLLINATLTFATAALGRPHEVIWEIPAAAAEFLRPHAVVLTFAAAAVPLIEFSDKEKFRRR